MRRWWWVGAVLWLLRPGYIVVELVVASEASGYSLVGDTVSRLGSGACSPSFCSPWRDLMNGTFIGVGLMLAAGALLMRERLGPAVTALLCIAGISSIATGLTPIDDGTLHAVAAAPLFLCQPLALVLLARSVHLVNVHQARALHLSAALCAVAALGFVAGAAGVGAWERVALWTPLLALAAVPVMTAERPGLPRDVRRAPE